MKTPASRRLVRCGLLLATAASVLLTFSGCVSLWGGRDSSHESSSIVQFLYPDKTQPFIQPQIPTLRLPLKVGVAFVPPGVHGSSYYQSETFPEQQKTELLKKVSAQFKSLPFVSSIEVVPTTYLRPGGGFDNLEQLQGLMGIDVMVLIAYDQVQNSSDTPASFAYWTIVGAYVIPAQKNETHTLVEAVVYDIPSRSLLFRAPGTSAIKVHSTLIDNEGNLRDDARHGLDLASVDMTAHLAQELESFKVRIREQPDTVHIEHRPGYIGGGALDSVFVVLVLACLGGIWAVRALRSRDAAPPAPTCPPGSRRTADSTRSP